MDVGVSASTASADALFMIRPPAFAGKALDEKIQELADREELRGLIFTYAHRVVHGQANADLFTDDGACINCRDPHNPAIMLRVELRGDWTRR